MVALTWVHIDSWHILRFDDPEGVLCGLEVGEGDEMKDEISVIDTCCENCLRLHALRTDKEPTQIP